MRTGRSVFTGRRTLVYDGYMNIAIVLAAVTALATTAGGSLALRSRDRLHLVLGLSAGLLLGLVSFDLLPEVFDASSSLTGGVRTKIGRAHV